VAGVWLRLVLSEAPSGARGVMTRLGNQSGYERAVVCVCIGV
jgi:hypothetical protein